MYINYIFLYEISRKSTYSGGQQTHSKEGDHNQDHLGHPLLAPEGLFALSAPGGAGVAVGCGNATSGRSFRPQGADQLPVEQRYGH